MHSPLVRRLTLVSTLALILCLRAVTSESVGNCAIFSTIGATGTVTSTYLNSSFTTVGITNDVPSCMDDWSASTTQMQTTADPYSSNTESLATTLAGELERLRYQIAAMQGTQYWYHRAASYGWARGITATNNSGTPDTQFDLDADTVILGCPTCGHVVRINPGAAITNNVSTSGPAANGRDQSGAFTADTFIHFYWIWNGTTLATLSSATAPPTSIASTLPTGYTHWAYCCAVYFPSSALRRVRVRGSWVDYDVGLAVVTAGTATAEEAISLSVAAPTNALRVRLDWVTGSISSATPSYTAHILVVSGSEFAQRTTTLAGLTNTAHSFSPGLFIIPNVAQQFYYYISGTGSSPTATINVTGYEVPNGS